MKVITLWEQLINELSNLLDAHGVCASATVEVATFTNMVTVVALYSQQKKLYDIWICRADGDLTQTRWEHVHDMFLLVQNAGKTQFIEKFDRSVAEQIRNELWHLAQKNVMIAPLPMPANNFTPKGIIAIIDPPPDFLLTPQDFDTLATHISTYLDRAYLSQKSIQQEIEFTIVSDISHALTATLNLENIYEQLRDPVRRSLNVESISIGLYDVSNQEIVFVNTLMGPLFQDLPPIRVKLGQGIAGYVAEHGEPLIVNRVYDDFRFNSRIDDMSGFETHSILCVPLRVENKVIGVLEAINKQNGPFTHQDLRLLQAISGPLAAAMENTNLHMDVVAEKRRIETMFASMSEGILTMNAQGYITAVNKALATLLQVSSEQLVGQKVEQAIQLEKKDFMEFVNAVFQKTENYPQIACSLHQADNQYVPVLISGTTIPDKNYMIREAIFVFSDLRQVRELERMRDDFFHNIIHELRTPLATILMYARLLRDGKTKDDIDKTDRFLGVIERESDRLQRMVRQMLQVVKLEVSSIKRSSEPIDLNMLFDEILPPLADRALEKGLLLVQTIEEDLPSVFGDEETLYIIFKNLVENGIKFTQAGNVSISASRETGKIVVVVQDDGIGIPHQAMPNLFKRFYRTATAVERGIAGTGLGLYMIKEGVDKHGGTIEVESEEGQGTTFTVKLPAFGY